MNRCDSEDFFFDLQNNIFVLQVADSFDTSQGMFLGEMFRGIAKQGTASMFNFSVPLKDLVPKQDWFTRYEEVKDINVPCLIILGPGYDYEKLSDEQYAMNIATMFKKDRSPAIYMGNNVFGHIHRKADALSNSSWVTPLVMNNQVFYRYVDHSLYGWTYGRALVFMFNPFIPILRKEEIYQSPQRREGYVGIHKDAYAKYKSEIVARIAAYSMYLNKQVELLVAQRANGVMVSGISLFLKSGWGLFIGTKEDYANYQKYTILPFKTTDDGSVVRKSIAELQADKTAKEIFKKRYAIAEKRVNIIKELLQHTHWTGWTSLSLSSRAEFEDAFDKDNSHYKVWINSNVRHLKSGWRSEKDLLDLLNNEGVIPTEFGLCQYWGKQVETLSQGKYKVVEISTKSKFHSDESEYRAKVKIQNGKTQTFKPDALKDLALKLGYKEKKLTQKDLEGVIKHPIFLNKYCKLLESRK